MIYFFFGILIKVEGYIGFVIGLFELVSTLRGLLDVVRVLVLFGVFWVALVVVVSVVKFCNCIVFNFVIFKARDELGDKGVSYLF